MIFALALASAGIPAQAYEFDDLYASLPFRMEKVQRPKIPARKVCIKDFGAKGDGTTLNTVDSN